MLKKLDVTQLGKESDNILSGLQQRVVGQVESLNKIVEVYQIHRSKLQDNRGPIGTFLFLGSTGTGKTYTVESLADVVFGNSNAVLKINCAEFRHSHEIAKLLGSPPGYLGHCETTALLVQRKLDMFKTKEHRISFVLFDEIEKASDSLWNLLLGILDTGYITLGDNTTTDFSESMIFMTSNLGVKELNETYNTSLGFSSKRIFSDKKSIDRVVLSSMKKKFNSEFINRIDKISIFNQLSKYEIEKILDLELKKIQEKLYFNYDIKFKLTALAKKFLIEKGTSAEYGARNLKRVLKTYVINSLANLIMSEQISKQDNISVRGTRDKNSLNFYLTKSTSCSRRHLGTQDACQSLVAGVLGTEMAGVLGTEMAGVLGTEMAAQIARGAEVVKYSYERK